MRKIFFQFLLLGMLPTLALAQFQPGDTDTSDVVEVRKGQTIGYDVSSVPGEVFRWAVAGGDIVFPAGAVNTPDSSIIEFADGLNVDSIAVAWDADDSTITSFAGSVTVQKLAAGSCPSTIQLLPVTLWSNPTASLDTTSVSYEICSGDPLAGSLVVDFTGAPNFALSYTITATGLTDGGAALDAVHTNIAVSNATYTIPLPAVIVNTSNTVTNYFTVTLTAMNDDFTGNGALIKVTTFDIAVYPTVSTGEIGTSHTLMRR